MRDKNIKTIKIYLVENCYGNPNKVYIGKVKSESKNVITRKSSHRNKFGRDISFNIIDENSDMESWGLLENYWIEQFITWGFDVMNKNKGGGGPQIHSEETKQKMRTPKSEETKQKMSIAHIDFKYSEETKQKMRHPKSTTINYFKPKSLEHRQNLCTCHKYTRSIIQYDLDNNFIKEHISIREAYIFLGENMKSTNINLALLGRQNTAYGYKWEYKNEKEIKK